MDCKNDMGYLHHDLTERIIGCFYEVYTRLGYGFLERVYERALVIELVHQGLEVRQQVPISVFYRGQSVGDYFADLLVENKVIVELKAAESVAVEHEVQLINYLRATGVEIGLLLNFGRKPEIRRKIYTREAHADPQL